MPRTTATRLAHLPGLDGVRGIAAIMVMIFHMGQAGLLNDGPGVSMWGRFLPIGQTGVDLFFVLSGFLITRILLESRTRHHFFRTFYFRRAVRIFPLYYLALTLFYFVLPFFTAAPHPPLRDSWWYWVYLQNIPSTFSNLHAYGPGHFWSLAVEEHFYLAWPILIFITPSKWMTQLCIITVLIAVACRLWFLTRGWDVFHFTLCRLDGLAIGSLLAVWERRLVKAPSVNAKLLATAFAIVLPTLIAWPLLSGRGMFGVQLVKYSLLAMLYGTAIAYLVASPKSLLNRALSTKALTLTGAISYGLYVYHPMCYDISMSCFSPYSRNLQAFFAILFTFVVAIASYQFFERPFLQLKRHASYESAEDSVTAIAVSTESSLG